MLANLTRSTDSRSSDDRRGALGGRLKISPAVSVEILYRDLDQKIPPRVDCGVLFLGSHLGRILETYSEAVRLFSETRDPAELLKRLEGVSGDSESLRERHGKRKSLPADA
jgi:hypothetical protein